MTARILLAEDDASLRIGLSDTLRDEGYEVVAAGDGHEAQAALRDGAFDLLVLDIMLPGPSGLELLRALRRRDADTPVLLLTARGSEGDKVLGLELGADDYVAKPFSLRELLARVKALLRRGQRERSAADGRFALGDLDVDLDGFRLVRDGKQVATLSPTEAAMLGLLRREQGRAVSRARFLAALWGGDGRISDRTIDTHVLNLRAKLERDPKRPRWLCTVHGVGYRLAREGEGS